MISIVKPSDLDRKPYAGPFLILSNVWARDNITIEDTSNLRIYYPQVRSIDHNFERQPKDAQKLTSRNCYRVLAEYNDKLCIINSKEIRTLP